MEHRINIEIIIKTDFSKQEEDKITTKVNTLKIDPEVIQSLLPQLMEVFKKDSPEKSKEKEVVNK